MNQNFENSPSVYFPNLNAIRFLAVAFVIVHHIEQFKLLFDLQNYWSNALVRIGGQHGLMIFFVLSGFLISYLLFKEKDFSKRISVKDFYLRRAFRIWPLYFTILFLSLFVMPFIEFMQVSGLTREFLYEDLPAKLSLYIFLLPNLIHPIFGFIPFASATWSIGAEEQFYFLWPLLINRFKNKWLVLFGVLLLYIGIGFALKNSEWFVLKSFWNLSPISCMAIGGIYAALIYESNPLLDRIKKILFTKSSQYLSLFLLSVFIYRGSFAIQFNYEVYSILYGHLILNLTANPNRIFSLENPILNYLGKISYGLYLIHTFVLVFVLKAAMKFDVYNNFLLYPIIFLLTIVLSILSYEFFEKYFIKKKSKHSKFITGDRASEF